MKSFEHWVDDHTVLIADIHDKNEFYEPVMVNFSVLVYIRGIEHDVTKALSENIIESYKEDLRQAYYEINESKRGFYGA